MRILFDQGTPAPLRRGLVGHIVRTAYEMGWSDLENGDLLDTAERDFDAFITTDQSLKHQQNLSGRRLAILVLNTTSWPRIRRHIALVMSGGRNTPPERFPRADPAALKQAGDVRWFRFRAYLGATRRGNRAASELRYLVLPDWL